MAKAQPGSRPAAWLPQAMPRILNVLFDLAILPSRCRTTEVGLEQIPDRLAIDPGDQWQGRLTIVRDRVLTFRSLPLTLSTAMCILS